jgi:hypothetical protein
MAKSNSLRRYIYKKGKALKEVDKFNNNVNLEEL